MSEWVKKEDPERERERERIEKRKNIVKDYEKRDEN